MIEMSSSMTMMVFGGRGRCCKSERGKNMIEIPGMNDCDGWTETHRWLLLWFWSGLTTYIPSASFASHDMLMIMWCASDLRPSSIIKSWRIRSVYCSRDDTSSPSLFPSWADVFRFLRGVPVVDISNDVDYRVCMIISWCVLDLYSNRLNWIVPKSGLLVVNLKVRYRITNNTSFPIISKEERSWSGEDFIHLCVLLLWWPTIISLTWDLMRTNIHSYLILFCFIQIGFL